jgi:hypothetical protein
MEHFAVQHSAGRLLPYPHTLTTLKCFTSSSLFFCSLIKKKFYRIDTWLVFFRGKKVNSIYPKCSLCFFFVVIKQWIVQFSGKSDICFCVGLSFFVVFSSTFSKSHLSKMFPMGYSPYPVNISNYISFQRGLHSSFV